MAYAALNSLVQTLEQILLDPGRYSFPCEKQLVESLHRKLGYLQEFLEDLSPKNINEETACLERRIRDSVNEAEDIIDLYLINEIHENVCLLEIADEFDSIIKEAEKIKNKLGSGIKGEVESPKKEATEQSWNSSGAGSSKLALNLMVGLHDDLIQIKDRLTGHPSVLKVISIVGMGGIGKTTLATNIYTDPFIRRHFDIHAWATVSQSYCIRSIMLDILHSIKKLTDEMQQESDDQLRLHLYQTLKNRRYLIIIDDIWDINAWDGMRRMLPDDNTGSRIILTTRISDVAAYASSSEPLHHMSLLSEELSWILLCAKVFGKEPYPFNLQELGKKIVKKCRGLPLSIVVIGGLLSKLNITQEAWQEVAENVTIVVNSSDDQCSKILELSYSYLPQRLKACFLYLGAFPEDYEILVSKLTKLWVAEGFVKRGRFQSLEEEAERYLEELADRSLILVSKQKFDGKIKRFRIHDLLRQLCVNEAKCEKFLQVIKWYAHMSPGSSHGQRRTSIHSMELFQNHCFCFNSIPSNLFTHSLLCMGNYSFSSNVFQRFKFLRVLDAIQVEFKHFPFEILELLNLRLVTFMYRGEIPASITKLQNLQTLIIHQKVPVLWTENVSVYLPVEIWELTHLRHVEFTSAYLLDLIAAPFDRDGKDLVLKDLQTISGIRNLRFTEDLLKRIANVKKLEISYDDVICWREEGWSYYHLENLVNLHQLEVLKIFVIPDVFTPFTGLISLPMSFTFPHTLKMLTLSGCEIPWKDLAMVSSLPNLEVLRLKDEACSGKNWEPNDWGFCKLKILELEDLDLKHWKADHNSFPSLEHLILRHCYDLVEIPCEMGESPTLTKIEVDDMNDSLLISAHKIKEVQQGLGNDDLQVVLNLTLKSNVLRRAAFRVWKDVERLTYQNDNPMQESEQLKMLALNYCICFLLRSCPEYAEISEKFYETFITEPLNQMTAEF